ncbi:unnamed protein product [Candidula unifasciata]|uniref:Uncharacterized protein n=1 Tax=Candidula unifasciata TaxID=100452 RepID=A0A8S4A5C6_9EUPU|nr:unnamed protein product [Candidula unifasciata]
MAPTMQVEELTLSSSATSLRASNSDSGAKCSFAVPAASTGDVAIRSESCLQCKQALHNTKTVIPEASSVFKEALDKLNLEKAQDDCKKENVQKDDKTLSSQPAGTTQTSFLTKLKSAFKPSPSGSPRLSPCRSEGVPSKTSAVVKPVRRPASFGGSDGIKLSAGRRSSQFEKRVSWADEYGSNHPLFSVRLIRPRLSVDNNHCGQSTPGHSILRTTGIC